MMNLFSVLIALFSMANPIASGNSADAHVQISLVRDGQAGLATNHGWEKVKAALSAAGLRYEEVPDAKTAHGGVLIVAGSASSPVADRLEALGVKIPQKPESLVIHKGEWQGKQALLLSGRDDRGLMYALLEVADRIGWKNKALPFSEVQDTVESPDVTDRDVITLTMQGAQYEDRLHDENYWIKYFDMLADDRFNAIELKFAYEANGYNCPGPSLLHGRLRISQCKGDGTQQGRPAAKSQRPSSSCPAGSTSAAFALHSAFGAITTATRSRSIPARKVGRWSTTQSPFQTRWRD